MEILKIGLSGIYCGDASTVLKIFPDECVDCVFTSPSPPSDSDDITNLCNLFSEVKRVLKNTGSLWVQMGSYHIDGDMSIIPEKFVINMVSDNDWHLKSKLIWHRTEKFTYQDDYNRFVRNWEYLFFFTKQKNNYYFNNPENKILSSIISAPYTKSTRFVSGFPEELIQKAITYSCPKGGRVLDPLADSGTTGIVAKKMGRDYIMIDIDEKKVSNMMARFNWN